MTMKPKIKSTWVDDLRSDRFPQTTGKLVGPALIENPTDAQRGAWENHPDSDGEAPKDPDVKGYCCLGVLTDQAIRSGEMNSLIRYAPGHEFEIEVWMNPEGDFADKPEFVDPDGQWEEFTDNDLPLCVAVWAGITDKRSDDDERYAEAVTEMQRREARPQTNNPRLGSERAITRNDNLRQTFAQIADAIEGDDLL